MEALRPYFREGVTIALLGSSGVGKSTLVNRLLGREIMKTSAIREKDGKGRHTTTARQLFVQDGVTLIDGDAGAGAGGRGLRRQRHL